MKNRTAAHSVPGGAAGDAHTQMAKLIRSRKVAEGYMLHVTETNFPNDRTAIGGSRYSVPNA